MKYIELFEDHIDELSSYEKKCHFATIYLEKIQPITEEDGFVECLYGDIDPNHLLLISFYYKDWISEDSNEKICDFFDKNKLKIHGDVIYHQKHHLDEYIIKLSKYQLNKYSKLGEIMNTSKKYNVI